MFLLLFTFLLINSSTAKFGCPTFNWVSTFKSEQGIPLLNIKYPDNLEDDFAVLKKMNNTSITVCVLEGHLMIERNASVKITKRCDSENDFQIEINSRRLAYSTFNVTNGKANPVLPIEASNLVSVTKTPPPISFPRNGLVLRLKAFYDVSFNSKFGRASTDLIEAIIEETQILFSLPSLTVDIKIELVGVNAINETISSANQNLTTFFERRSTSEGENVTNTFLFFTGKSFNKDFKNPRNGNEICSTKPKERSAIVSWRSSKTETSKDLAKEVGYLLGMNDDFKWNLDNSKVVTRFDSRGKTCTNINGIMDFSSEHMVWSTCSVEDFLNYYNTVRTQQPGGQFCLIENPTQPKITVYSKVLVALGYNGSTIADVEIIDLLSSETICQKPQNFPYPYYCASGGLGFQEKPLICGGWNNNRLNCHLYENGAWKTSDSLKGRNGFALTKSPFQDGSNSKLFMTGGRDEYSYLNSTEVLTENGWQVSVPLPVPIGYHCMVTVNSTSVVVIGGYSNQFSERSFFFNSETNIWTEGPTLNTARIYHSCGLIRKNSQTEDKSLIVVGGNNDRPLNSVEVLGLDSTSWRKGPELPFGIEGPAMVEDPSGGVVLIGGIASEYGPLDTLYRLPHAGSDATWKLMSQKLKTPRLYHTAFLIPDDVAACN